MLLPRGHSVCSTVGVFDCSDERSGHSAVSKCKVGLGFAESGKLGLKASHAAADGGGGDGDGNTVVPWIDVCERGMVMQIPSDVAYMRFLPIRGSNIRPRKPRADAEQLQLQYVTNVCGTCPCFCSQLLCRALILCTSSGQQMVTCAPSTLTRTPTIPHYNFTCIYTYVRKNSEISESVLSSKLIHAMIEVFPQNMTHFDEKHHAAFSRDVGALALGCRMEQKLQTIARLKVQNQKLNL